MNTSEVPFGLELKAERLMAERKRRGHVLSNYQEIYPSLPQSRISEA